MDIQSQRTFAPMTAAADIASTQAFSRRLTAAEARRAGVPESMARTVVARREGIAPGTLENIERGRAKSVAGWIRDKLRAAVLREIEREIARLECERAALVATAYRVDDAAISEIDALLAKVRALMEGKS